MREIKFRIPHYDYKGNFSHFTYWGNIDHKGDFSSDTFTGPAYSNLTIKKDSEQYTGLKDRNGNEIYEGDICLWKDYDNPKPIYFVDGAFMLKDFDVSYSLHNICNHNSGIMSITNRADELEIIGNIHENPDLL